MLCSWTVAGNRPVFDLVTGISTGALLAPFAFLGPKYDQQLRNFYTTISPDDILEERGMISGIFDDGLADNSPLRSLVAKAVTEEMFKEIAAEHFKGRFLLVATTNLDARRPVIWNMTKIAASGAPGSLELFRDILVASAAIPGVFVPVQIDGRTYVDGGGTDPVPVDVVRRMGAEVVIAVPISSSIPSRTPQNPIEVALQTSIIMSSEIEACRGPPQQGISWPIPGNEAIAREF